MKTNIYNKNQTLPGELPQKHGVENLSSQPSVLPAKAGSAKWIITALLVLSAFPLTAGAFRLLELTGWESVAITPSNARFFSSPLPVVLHIVGAAFFALMGPFQFAGRFRSRRPGWHRRAGRFLVACGLVVGFSAIWMNLFYPRAAGSNDGGLLFVFRLVFGLAMVGSIVLGFSAIRQGDVARHRAWMTRAYAIGLGAGTQVLTLMAGEIIAGPPTELSRVLLMGSAWVINLGVAEWVIRKRRQPIPRHQIYNLKG